METNPTMEVIKITMDGLQRVIESLLMDMADLRKRCHQLADVTLDEIKDGIDRSVVREKYANRIKREIPTG